MGGYSDGIILRQTKILGGRRMVTLFSKEYGKISAGTRIDERGKSKAALSMRPFVHGRYEIRDLRGNHYINSAEVVRSYYKIGEDVDKFMACSYVLEFLGKITQEDQPVPGLFDMTCDFLDVMERRKGHFGTLVLAYVVKATAEIGYEPEIGHCVSCGRDEPAEAFSVKDGGILCRGCLEKKKGEYSRRHINSERETLIYEVDFGIVDILRYFLENPFRALEKLALDEKELTRMKAIMKQYSAYYLDLGDLKSEGFIADD